MPITIFPIRPGSCGPGWPTSARLGPLRAAAAGTAPGSIRSIRSLGPLGSNHGSTTWRPGASAPLDRLGGVDCLLSRRPDDRETLGFPALALGGQDGGDGDPFDVDLCLSPQDIADAGARGEELAVEHPLGLAGAGGAPRPASVRAFTGQFDGDPG